MQLLISVLLISSTAALHINEDNVNQKTTVPDNINGDLPTFEGIKAYEENKTIYLDSINIRQKIALNIVSYRYSQNISDGKIIGGIHLRSADSRQEFKSRINNYKEGRKIEPLVSADLEGCIEPTSSFKDFKSFKKVKSPQEAFELGKNQGKFLSEIGVDINFAPVVDREDNIWGCRAFPGSYRKIANKSCSYIRGLHSEKIMATAKHYPGATLTGKDPHVDMKHVNVTRKDLHPFDASMKCGTDAVMPSFQISNGAVDTNGEPADVSDVVRKRIRNKHNFKGLIVSDAISMAGLKDYYESKDERYLDIFRTNDLVLNLVGGVNDTVEMIDIIKTGVKQGKLQKKYVDASTRRILNARGWNVVVKKQNTTKTYKKWVIRN